MEAFFFLANGPDRNDIPETMGVRGCAFAFISPATWPPGAIPSAEARYPWRCARRAGRSPTGVAGRFLTVEEGAAMSDIIGRCCTDYACERY
jgi:hypothetical protein